ncbi:MAG: PAS domain S-box protein [Chitinivibrionales bacterium]|nr:PAS domain S-box protein [Chitinivibrionales bacterium]
MTLSRGRNGSTMADLPPEALKMLQTAFADFEERAEKLSNAYAAMQEDFRKINIELDKKNEELAASLARRQEIQTYLSSILESMNNGVIGIDIAGTITHFNRAASDITGYAQEEVVGKSYADFFRSRDDGDPTLLDTLSSGKELTLNEKVVWARDGHPVPVSYQTSVLREKDAGLLGAVEIFTDISRIKALEEEMQQAKTMAAVGEMAATVAHEIRNPLGAMGVWAGLLERDLGPDDPRKKTVGKIIEGLSRLNRIVSNLLVYCRPVKASLRKINLKELLSEITDFVEIEIERRGQHVDLHKNWSAGNTTMVSADPEKLQQVIMNLCLNAVQAMPGGGRLTVALNDSEKQQGDFISFTVSDTGTGIEEDRLNKIFDPFHTTKENGTGLGLAIVKKMVDYHSGHINVSSRPGEGTVFSVFLPRTQ